MIRAITARKTAVTDAHRFLNGLKIMLGLDEVYTVLGPDRARRFHEDPIRSACHMSDDEWRQVYALIEARQPKETA